MRCAGCGSRVVNEQLGRCPNCGAAVSPGRGKPSSVSVWVVVPCVIAVAFVAIAVIGVKGKAGGGAGSQHLAPIEPGAVPDRIGCAEGCDNLNRFEKWQPYMSKAVEVHRRQEKCKAVEYVSVDQQSSPESPTFWVMCRNDKGQSYNTYYTKAQIDAGVADSGADVDQGYALRVCEKELPRYFAGYFAGAVTEKSFYVAPNGRARVTYDLVINGKPRVGSCLVGHDFVEFTVVK